MENHHKEISLGISAAILNDSPTQALAEEKVLNKSASNCEQQAGSSEAHSFRKPYVSNAGLLVGGSPRA